MKNFQLRKIRDAGLIISFISITFVFATVVNVFADYPGDCAVGIITIGAKNPPTKTWTEPRDDVLCDVPDIDLNAGTINVNCYYTTLYANSVTTAFGTNIQTAYIYYSENGQWHLHTQFAITSYAPGFYPHAYMYDYDSYVAWVAGYDTFLPQGCSPSTTQEMKNQNLGGGC